MVREKKNHLYLQPNYDISILGFTSFGLGPLPSDPFARRKLGDVLDQVEKGDTQLVYDIKLALIKEDENDQGSKYYI